MSRKSPAGFAGGAVVKRTATIRVISFVLFATCGALCQKPPSIVSPQGFQFDSSNSLELRTPQLCAERSLPDAPSALKAQTHVERTFRFVNTAALPSMRGADTGAMRETLNGHFIPGPQHSLTRLYPIAFVQEAPSAFLAKYLYPPLLIQDTHYYGSTSNNFMGRASYAASRIFVTRDDSGKARLNTRYFLGVLSSVALHAAYRPYQTRSNSETLNNFGSTIGGDAGINVFHEFKPGVRQMLKGLTPKFASRIEERLTHNPISK